MCINKKFKLFYKASYIIKSVYTQAVYKKISNNIGNIEREILKSV